MRTWRNVVTVWCVILLFLSLPGITAVADEKEDIGGDISQAVRMKQEQVSDEGDIDTSFGADIAESEIEEGIYSDESGLRGNSEIYEPNLWDENSIEADSVNPNSDRDQVTDDSEAVDDGAVVVDESSTEQDAGISASEAGTDGDADLSTAAESFSLSEPESVGKSNAVMYDAADFPNLKGRTKKNIMDRYTAATAVGATYVGSNTSTYYDVPASIEAPYAQGVLSSDTLKAMGAMSNFYRWLVGVEEYDTNLKSDASMQAQAFDRNFEFNHYISYSSKPNDMDAALWDEGFECTHNILAMGYTPVGAITGWLNEGYNISGKTWDTVGHREAILAPDRDSIVFGYSGYVAIGDCIYYDGRTFANAFSAFPAAGYMPADLVNPYRSSWTVDFNTDVVRADDESKVVIKVKNLTTGLSYSCTKANGKAEVYWSGLNFVQPSDMGDSGVYQDSYKVTVTGLYDVKTGKEASITYTVNFFELPELGWITLPKTIYSYTGKAVKPKVSVSVSGSGATLKEGRDYTVTYRNNVNEGLGIVEATGIGNYCGTVKYAFTIRKLINIEKASVGGVSLSYGYSGKEYTPALTVKVNGVTLIKDRDYTVKYENNRYPGTAKITITGKGNYTGNRIKTFEIVDCVSSVVSGKTYQLIPKNNSKTAVCSFAGRMVNNTKVYITDRSNSEAMKFKAVQNADGTWKFINAKCELALAVQQNSTAVGAGTVLYDQTTRTAQNWKLSRKSDNSFAIMNAVTGYSIAMSDASAVKGTTLSMAETASSGLQRFYIAETSAVNAPFDGTYAVKASKDTKFALNADGSNVNLYMYNDTNAQRFRIIYSGGGYYRLVNVNSGLVLTVKGNTQTDGANVIQGKWAAESGQRWKITKNSDGTVSLTNALGTVLHLNGNKTANGTNVAARMAASTKAQRWYLG